MLIFHASGAPGSLDLASGEGVFWAWALVFFSVLRGEAALLSLVDGSFMKYGCLVYRHVRKQLVLGFLQFQVSERCLGHFGL